MSRKIFILSISMLAITASFLCSNTLTANAATNAQRVLYSQVFDAAYYASTYPDVYAAFGDDATKLLNHYIDNGVKEGRNASASFNATTYLNNYSDLSASFGTDYTAAIKHYVEHGISEGRTAVNSSAYAITAAAKQPSVVAAVPVAGFCSYTTYYDPNVPRATNVALAASKINGYVIQPGAEFSYNAVVGQRTTAAGFVNAPVFAGGRHSYGIGGGICQVSSTLYAACLTGGIQASERHAHSLAVTYVPSGWDATVSWGTKDFRFVNTLGRAITIYASANNGVLTVSLL